MYGVWIDGWHHCFEIDRKLTASLDGVLYTRAHMCMICHYCTCSLYYSENIQSYILTYPRSIPEYSIMTVMFPRKRTSQQTNRRGLCTVEPTWKVLIFYLPDTCCISLTLNRLSTAMRVQMTKSVVMESTSQSHHLAVGKCSVSSRLSHITHYCSHNTARDHSLHCSI